MNKKNIVAGNWKMNKTPLQGKRFIDDVKNRVKDIHNTEIIFFPAFTGLLDNQLNYPFHLGAQNCHWETSGAFTGEVSTEMLNECNVQYILAGHSERRQLFKETDAVIFKKAKSAIKNKLIPYHKFNEKKSLNKIIQYLNEGKILSLITDAGTPVLSDPGNMIINECIKNDFKIFTIPGPSAVSAAVSLSGFGDKFLFKIIRFSRYK